MQTTATRAVLGVLLGSFALLHILGQKQVGIQIPIAWWEHGWPWIAVERWGFQDRTKADLVSSSPWLISFPPQSEFHPQELAFDLLLMVWVVGQSFRWLRQFQYGRARPQFGLRTLFAILTTTGVLLALWPSLQISRTTGFHTALVIAPCVGIVVSTLQTCDDFMRLFTRRNPAIVAK